MIHAVVKRIACRTDVGRALWNRLREKRSRTGFAGSQAYWDQRYKTGGTSGAGSYGRLALFKAEILNRFVAEHHVTTVVEFGCGDGEQLELARYPDYVGLDVSRHAIDRCRLKFSQDKSKRFHLADDEAVSARQKVDLALSLDVLYHLVEDAVFTKYMTDLFGASQKYVIVYSSNVDKGHHLAHIRHRRFTDWVGDQAPQWRLTKTIENRYPADLDSSFDDRSFAQFYIFACDEGQPDARLGPSHVGESG